MNVNDLLDKSAVGQVAKKGQADVSSQNAPTTSAPQAQPPPKSKPADLPTSTDDSTNVKVNDNTASAIPAPVPVQVDDIPTEQTSKPASSADNVPSPVTPTDNAKKDITTVESSASPTLETTPPKLVPQPSDVVTQGKQEVNTFDVNKDLPELKDSFDYPKVEIVNDNKTVDDISVAGENKKNKDKNKDKDAEVPKSVASGELNTQPQEIKVPDEKNAEVEKKDLEVIKASNRFSFTMEQLFEIVVQKNASDLHIAADYPVQIRVDGDLLPINNEVLDANGARELIYSILSEELKEVVEVNKEVDFAYAYENVARFRINVYHAMGNLSGAFRLIPSKIRTLEELKLPKLYHELTSLRQGLILVTGPTGHGKSTTLAAILNEINLNQPKHIITIEDPVEYVYPKGKALVDQREMKQDTHGWDIALKSVLREDPDIVLVGEMRDYETISAAITVAETGHLVLATLHTNSAAQTIDRIIDVFPEHQQGQIRTQLATVVEAVVAQRLVKLIGGGRRAVSEVMLGTPAVRNIIREGKTYQLDNVIRTSRDVGMISIERSLVELVREGVLTVEDAQSYAISPEEVIRLLK